MPDSPDYQKYLPSSIRFSLQDMGELAVRNGSIDTFDRRGEITVIDDFSHGLSSWTISVDGTGAKVLLSADKSFVKPYVCKLVSGSDGTWMASILRRFAVFSTNRIGIEFCFATPTNHDHIDFLAPVIYNNKIFSVQVLFSNLTRLIQILDDASVFQTIVSNQSIQDTNIRFHNLKIVFDLITKTYIRLIYNTIEYDLSKYKIGITNFVGQPYLTTQVRLIGTNAINSSINLAYVILTGNEP